VWRKLRQFRVGKPVEFLNYVLCSPIMETEEEGKGRVRSKVLTGLQARLLCVSPIR